MKKVDKSLKKGRSNCAGGNHWYIMDYFDYLLCPVCGHKKPKDETFPECNSYIVREPIWKDNR